MGDVAQLVEKEKTLLFIFPEFIAPLAERLRHQTVNLTWRNPSCRFESYGGRKYCSLKYLK